MSLVHRLPAEGRSVGAGVQDSLRAEVRSIDQLIRTKQLAGENTRISASVTHYYDVIDEEEMEENRTWGQFAQTQLREGRAVQPRY